MYRKLIVSLTPLLAATAFAVIPAVAQGAVWEHCVQGKGAEEFKDHQCNGKAPGGGWIWQVIPETTATSQTKDQVKFAGFLTLVVNNGQRITCYARGKGVVWNENGQGHDEITQFINAQCVPKPACSPVSIVPEALPYKSVLLQGPPIMDEITGIKVHVVCNTIIASFTGTLKPTVSTENGETTFSEGSGTLIGPKPFTAFAEGTVQIEQESGWAVRVHA